VAKIYMDKNAKKKQEKNCNLVQPRGLGIGIGPVVQKSCLECNIKVDQRTYNGF
jgi:hypothetical protein